MLDSIRTTIPANSRAAFYAVAAATVTALVSWGVLDDAAAPAVVGVATAVVTLAFAVIHSDSPWRQALYSLAAAPTVLATYLGYGDAMQWESILAIAAPRPRHRHRRRHHRRPLRRRTPRRGLTRGARPRPHCRMGRMGMAHRHRLPRRPRNQSPAAHRRHGLPTMVVMAMGHRRRTADPRARALARRVTTLRRARAVHRMGPVIHPHVDRR